MTWTRYALSTWALDAFPIDAGVMVDIVRGDLRHVGQQPPMGSTAWTMNGRRTTGATDYDDPLSVVWRGGSRHIRAGLGAQARNIGFKVNAYMSAGTATLRAMAVSAWRIGGGGSTSVQSAVDEVVSVTATAPTEVTLLLPLIGLGQTFLTGFGSGGANRRAVLYNATYVLLQAIVNSAPNIMTLVSCTPYEVDPT